MGIHAVKPAVFLDRDGVLNRAIVRNGRPYPPQRLDDLEILHGVQEALERLKTAGFATVVVTNQPDVARGLQTREVVETMHAHLAALLPLDEIRVCYHDDRDGCSCRKPKPGLLTQPPVYDLARSVMIGDRWRDVEAGRRAGCRAAILIDYGYEEDHSTDEPDVRVRSLVESVDWILTRCTDDLS
jgi:D-glycero-D-manno-heptose 1,7-bisphosphate phosphatase